MAHEYEINPKGHEWIRDSDGDINVFAFNEGICNGPKCKKCDYEFCHHCIKYKCSEPCIINYVKSTKRKKQP